MVTTQMEHHLDVPTLANWLMSARTQNARSLVQGLTTLNSPFLISCGFDEA